MERRQMNKYFVAFAVLLAINFLWSDVWMNNIIANPYFYFHVTQEGLDQNVTQLIATSNVINLFAQIILKCGLLGIGLKLLYDILRKLEVICDFIKKVDK